MRGSCDLSFLGEVDFVLFMSCFLFFFMMYDMLFDGGCHVHDGEGKG